MEDPIVIRFDGSVDCEFFQLLKQIAKNLVSDRADQNVRLLTSFDSIQTLRAELEKQDQIQNQLRKEYELLHPDHDKVLNIQEAYKSLQRQVHDVNEENKELENGIEKVKKGISEKKTYEKLQSLLGKAAKELGKKNKALKKEKERVLKKYDQVNFKTFQYKVREREDINMIRDNESLVEQIKEIRRNTANQEVMNIVSSHVTKLKEENVELIDQLRKLNQSQSNVYDKNGDIELKMLRSEQEAYLQCNNELRKESKKLMSKKMKQQNTEFKILQEREYAEMLANTNTELRQQVEKIYGSLEKASLLELGFTSDLRLDGIIRIQKGLKPDVETQTTVVTLELPDGLKQPALMKAEGEATMVREAGAGSGAAAENFEVGTPTVEEEVRNEEGMENKGESGNDEEMENEGESGNKEEMENEGESGNKEEMENEDENPSPGKLEKDRWSSDEYF